MENSWTLLTYIKRFAEFSQKDIQLLYVQFGALSLQ